MTAVDELLHLGARVLLHACSPQVTLDALRRVGRVLPRRETHAQVRDAATRLRGGSCLSRALAIAARAPSAELVIGVQPERGKGLSAHAWLEIDGRPLDPSDPSGSEIVRLRGHRARPGGHGS